LSHLFRQLLFMLEDHCYITDTSITTYKNEYFNDLVVLETKNNQNDCKFCFCQHGQKRGFSVVERSKIVALHDERCSERSLSEKQKFSKTAVHQAMARFKTFGSFQELSRAGRPKVTSQRDEHIIKMVERSPTTSSKKSWADLLLTGADVSTFALKRRFSD